VTLGGGARVHARDSFAVPIFTTTIMTTAFTVLDVRDICAIWTHPTNVIGALYARWFSYTMAVPSGCLTPTFVPATSLCILHVAFRATTISGVVSGWQTTTTRPRVACLNKLYDAARLTTFVVVRRFKRLLPS